MAAVHGGVRGQGKQMFANAAHQYTHAAAGKIRSSHAAGKQNIAHKKFIVTGKIICDPVGGVAGYRQNLPLQTSPVCLAWGGAQHIIHLIRGNRGKPPGAGGFLQGQGFAVGRNGVNPAAGALLQLGGSFHMVKMLVGEQQMPQRCSFRQVADDPVGHAQRGIYRYIARICGLDEVAIATDRPAGVYLYFSAHARIIEAFSPYGEPKMWQYTILCNLLHQTPRQNYSHQQVTGYSQYSHHPGARPAEHLHHSRYRQ